MLSVLLLYKLTNVFTQQLNNKFTDLSHIVFNHPNIPNKRSTETDHVCRRAHTRHSDNDDDVHGRSAAVACHR